MAAPSKGLFLRALFYPLPRKQVDHLFHGQLFILLVFRQLIPYVLVYCFRILSNRIYIVSSIPEL